ncbi:MAG: hypothetical protein PVI98_10275 [Burkholderiales bacterium]|jgi:hypothetical protein
MRTGWLLLLLMMPLTGLAGECRVLDSELQGFYEGGCRNGLADGKGHAHGTAEYVGEFRKGKKDGQGVKTWAWGDRYEGEFKDDRKDGHGMYVWGAGSQWAGERYVGGFVNDKRQGFGTYYWPNGDRFDGEWKDDLRYGYSVMEQRRAAAFEFRRKAMGEPGVSVCSRMKIGIAEEVQLRGVTAQLEGVPQQEDETQSADATLVVKVISVRGSVSGLLPSFRPGAVVQSNVWDWTPCL